MGVAGGEEEEEEDPFATLGPMDRNTLFVLRGLLEVSRVMGLLWCGWNSTCWRAMWATLARRFHLLTTPSSVPVQFRLVDRVPPPEILQVNFMGGVSKFSSEISGGALYLRDQIELGQS